MFYSESRTMADAPVPVPSKEAKRSLSLAASVAAVGGIGQWNAPGSHMVPTATPCTFPRRTAESMHPGLTAARRRAAGAGPGGGVWIPGLAVSRVPSMEGV